MAATATPTRPTTSLQVGDKVTIRRDLNHPAWMHRIDGRDIGSMYIQRTDLPELIGVGNITATRRRSANRLGVGRRIEQVLIAEVQVGANSLWYDAESGSQVNSGATYISTDQNPNEPTPRSHT